MIPLFKKPLFSTCTHVQIWMCKFGHAFRKCLGLVLKLLYAMADINRVSKRKGLLFIALEQSSKLTCGRHTDAPRNIAWKMVIFWTCAYSIVPHKDFGTINKQALGGPSCAIIFLLYRQLELRREFACCMASESLYSLPCVRSTSLSQSHKARLRPVIRLYLQA